ncbi:MAG: methyltransferase domain-containing protein [Spirochaetia bacterium]|nr:methyltransferase domain-containing protein [Spirochaetia bacterium]
MSDRTTSNFQEFSAQDYLEEYYASIGEENALLLKFMHETYSILPPSHSLLEVGGGPTLYQLISASNRVDHITFSEYLEVNRNAVQAWINNAPGAFNWDPYIEFVLKLENSPAGVKDVEARKAQLKSKIKEVTSYNVFDEPPLTDGLKTYDIIASNFCLEGITHSFEQFTSFFRRMNGYLKPGGWMVLCMVKNAREYRVKDLYFPACAVDEQIMENVLKDNGMDSIHIETIPTVDPEQGHHGMLMIRGQKEGGIR